MQASSNDAEERADGSHPGDDCRLLYKSAAYMVPPGVIAMVHGRAEADVNTLHARDIDPISGFPSFKEGICRVRKAE